MSIIKGRSSEHGEIILKGGTPVISTLKKLRMEHGYTLRSLAEATGIAHPRISRMENRLEKVWGGDVQRIGEVLPLPEGGITDADGYAKIAE
jgi:transcriptional regulator with XRE-family HTH domain